MRRRANLNIPRKIKIASIGLATAIASSIVLVSAEAATITPNFDLNTTEITTTTPTHAVILKCKASKNQGYQSKGAILALPENLENPKRDFALVTGHGLDAEKDCFVSDFHGNTEKVLTRRFAKNYQAGTSTDWALISFKRIKGSHIKRYGLNNYLKDPSVLHNAPISFAQARGLPENSQRCKITVVELNTPNKTPPIYSHNCRAIPGQSGSPVTQTVDGNHQLVGFHIGYMWTLRSPITGKPGRFNYFRPYDKDMSAEIEQIINEME